MQTAWIQACLYQPPVVLGRQLQPFSSFHALALDGVRSPFWHGGAPTIDDLVLAVHICALTWETRAAVFGDVRRIMKWGRRQRKADHASELAAFRLYLDESNVYPARWKTSESSAIKASGFFHLVAFGMGRMNMSEAQAWDCPMARLVCYSEAHREQETGKSDLISEEESKGIEALKGAANG